MCMCTVNCWVHHAHAICCVKVFHEKLLIETYHTFLPSIQSRQKQVVRKSMKSLHEKQDLKTKLQKSTDVPKVKIRKNRFRPGTVALREIRK